MDVTSGVSGVTPDAGVQMVKKSQDLMKTQGAAAVKLINGANPAKSNPEGTGSIVNTYA